jgi:hypothetical protein
MRRNLDAQRREGESDPQHGHPCTRLALALLVHSDPLHHQQTRAA